MNEYYCIKIKIENSLANDLYVSESGRITAMFDAELMQFDQLHDAEFYIERNGKRFAKLYDSTVLLHPVQHIAASS